VYLVKTLYVIGTHVNVSAELLTDSLISFINRAS